MNLILVIGWFLLSRQQATPAAMALLLVGDQDQLSLPEDGPKDRDFLDKYELMSVLTNKRPDNRDVLVFDERHHQPVLQKKDTENDKFLAEKKNTCTAICNYCERLIHRKWTALCETECRLQSTNFKLCVAVRRVNIRPSK